MPRTIFGAFSAIIFFGANFAYADIGATSTFYSYDTGTQNTVFGNNDTQIGFCQRLATTSPLYIATTTWRLYKTGSPTDNLRAYVGHIHQDLNPNWDIHGTSTNTVSGTTITTSAQTYTFTFDPPLYIDINTEPVGSLYPGDNHGLSYYCIGVMRTGSSSASNYYRVQRDSSAFTIDYPASSLVSTALQQGSNLSGRPRGTISGYYSTEVPSGNCPTGYECYTLEEMASTTEAIYTVGSTMQIYLGIFLMLIFGYVAFVFARKFL